MPIIFALKFGILNDKINLLNGPLQASNQSGFGHFELAYTMFKIRMLGCPNFERPVSVIYCNL